MPATRFTELVGCELPLQLAPMGTVGTPELVAAVANAGGHGMLAAVTAPPPVLRQVIDQIGWLTGGPFGVNFLVPLIDPDCVEIAAHGAGLVEFFYGDPDPALVARVHGADGLASWQVGRRDSTHSTSSSNLRSAPSPNAPCGRRRSPASVGSFMRQILTVWSE